jgi:hypothetical protein
MCLTIGQIDLYNENTCIYAKLHWYNKINARVACPSLIAPRRELPTNMMLMLEGQGGGKGKLTSHVQEGIIAAVPQNISEPRAARTEEHKYWELGQHRPQQGSK